MIVDRVIVICEVLVRWRDVIGITVVAVVIGSVYAVGIVTVVAVGIRGGSVRVEMVLGFYYLAQKYRHKRFGQYLCLEKK